jgi:hypothetical protein
MSSKKQDTTKIVKDIQEAMRKVNLDVSRFFVLAAQLPKEYPKGYNPNNEARNFIALRNGQDYTPVPPCALELSKKILEKESPERLCNQLYARMHGRAKRLAARKGGMVKAGFSATRP